MTTLADAVALICAELGETHVAAIADACRSHPAFDASTRQHVISAVPAPHRSVIQPLIDRWSAAPATPGTAIVLALEAIAVADARADHADVRVVCTGPDTPVAPVRLTSQVVLDLIGSARSRVTICSFSSYRLAAVMAALDAATGRGVQIDLILESQAQLQHGGGAETFADHRVFVWPSEQRPPNARLHAKAVVIDARDILLTSANLSNAAFHANLELGVVIRGGGVARAVQQHFDALISSGTLRSAGIP